MLCASYVSRTDRHTSFRYAKKRASFQKETLFKRRRPDLNRCILVLQTIALPLGYDAVFPDQKCIFFRPLSHYSKTSSRLQLLFLFFRNAYDSFMPAAVIFQLPEKQKYDIICLLPPESRYADVAQLAEQLICNQQVIGSSPIIGSSDL